MAADAVLVLHLAFVLFVVAGGLCALRWRWVMAAHLPCALWGAVVELGGFACPLTPLENTLRTLGGEAGYAGGFVEHYLGPLIYPVGLTRNHQLVLGVVVVLLNLVAYGLVWRKWRRRRAPEGSFESSAGRGRNVS